MTVGSKRLEARRLVVVLAALALVAMACNGGASDGSGVPDTSQGGADTPTAAEGGDTTEAENPLAGETIEFVIPYQPGGGYDQYVRLIAPVLGECLDANVVPMNEPGAGSLAATNKTFTAAPDGTRIQILNGVGAVPAQIAQDEGVQFDLTEFSWIARISGQPEVLSVAADSRFETFEDLINSEDTVRFVSTGLGSSEYIGAVVLGEVYDFDIEVITGFEGSGEARSAVLSGDADAHLQTLDSVLPAVNSGDMRILAVVGEPHENAPDATALTELPPEDEDLQEVLDAAIRLGSVGRPVAAPPDLPEDVLTALRDGMECALTDEQFLATTGEQQRPIDYLPGEEIAELVEQLVGSPPAQFEELVKASF